MNRVIISIFIACLFYACSPSTPKENQQAPVKKPINKIVSVAAVTPSDSGIYRLNLADGKKKVEVRKKKNQTIYIEFESKGYKNISARLTSTDSLANIRFSQITLPGGKMDGPFGKDLDYKIPSDGIYKISINENIMAGDPWGGAFHVEVLLTK